MKGRPRSFSLEHGLDIAESSFMQFGFEGTSINMLCQQLKVPPTSLYSAYKDKQNLFEQVISRHADQLLELFGNMLGRCQTTGQIYRDSLELGVDLIYKPDKPVGILLLDAQFFVKNQNVAEIIRLSTEQFCVALSRAFGESGSENPTELANVVLTLLAGLSAAARSGKSEAESLTTVEFLCVGFDC